MATTLVLKIKRNSFFFFFFLNQVKASSQSYVRCQLAELQMLAEWLKVFLSRAVESSMSQGWRCGSNKLCSRRKREDDGGEDAYSKKRLI
jgi:hypothetical protein